MNAWKTVPKTITKVNELHRQITDGKLYEMLAKHPSLQQAIDGTKEVVQFGYADSPSLVYSLFPTHADEEMCWDDEDDLDLETKCLVTKGDQIPEVTIQGVYGVNRDRLLLPEIPKSLHSLIKMNDLDTTKLSIYQGAVVLPLSTDNKYICNVVPHIRRTDGKSYATRTDIVVDGKINAGPYTESSNVHIIEQDPDEEDFTLAHYWKAMQAEKPSTMSILVEPHIQTKYRNELDRLVDQMAEISTVKAELAERVGPLIDESRSVLEKVLPGPKLFHIKTFGMQEDENVVPVQLSTGSINHYY